MGSGCNQIDLHLSYRIGHTTIGKILRRVCGAIWEVLRTESFPEMTEKRWIDIAEGFQNYSQYPLCLGAIDGKHVRVRKPNMSGSLFYNYKNFFSIVLLGIVDANYKFIYIDVGAFGKESDSTIFEKLIFLENLKIMISIYQKANLFLVLIQKFLIRLSATKHFHFHQI